MDVETGVAHSTGELHSVLEEVADIVINEDNRLGPKTFASHRLAQQTWDDVSPPIERARSRCQLGWYALLLNYRKAFVSPSRAFASPTRENAVPSPPRGSTSRR